jgi:hypothetical protein
LKKEIQQLMRNRELDANLVFVSKYFHIDYSLLEKNLRQTIKRTLPKLSTKPIIVYGDLCLGPNGEMKKLADEYGLIKIEALNCVDCLLGGHGKIDEVDPNHEFMFFDPGMIEFFQEAREKLEGEGLDKAAIKNMFAGIKGIVLLDTLDTSEKCKSEIEDLDTGLKILETKKVGLNGLKNVLQEAIERKKNQN